MNANHNYQVGQRVAVDDPNYPGIWAIKKLGPVNAVLEPEAGGRGLRAPYYMLRDPADAVVPAGPPAVYYHAGELVRINAGRYEGLWVVIADKGGDKVNLAKLGGDGGRYLRAVRRGLAKVDPAEVLINA